MPSYCEGFPFYITSIGSAFWWMLFSFNIASMFLMALFFDIFLDLIKGCSDKTKIKPERDLD